MAKTIIPARFRAYTLAPMATTSARWPDGSPILNEDETAPGERRVVDMHQVEQVAIEGDLFDGEADFDSGDVIISKVVAYGGPADAEVVAGCVEVGKAGAISVKFGAD